MSPRSLVLVGLAVIPACYAGFSGEAVDTEATGSSSTGGPGGGPGGGSSDPSSTPGEAGESDPVTDGDDAGPTSVPTTLPGTSDMSAGSDTDPATSEPLTTGPGTSGPDTGDDTTGEPGTSEPGTTGMSTDTGDPPPPPPPDETAMLCGRWKADRAQLGEGSWNGDVNACNAGSVSQDGRDNALRLINLYRFIADLPPVSEDPAKTEKAQSCALMMHANGALNHFPPMNWKCFTAAGAEAAGKSNISSTPGVLGIDLYMVDPGNDTTIGHRRWILSNSLGGVGLGSTSQSSCLWVIGGDGNAGKPWMAWPPPGLVPYQAMHVPSIGWSDVDKTGWTVQSDSIDMNGAQVSVKEGGVDKPVAVNVLGQGYGSTHAVRFVPQGWAVQPGKTYDVQVTPQAISYSVTIVDCP